MVELIHQNTRSLWISLPVYVLVCIVIGFRQFGVYSIYHDAIHNVLCKNRWLNDILGTIFSGWLLCRSLGEHKYKHVNLHHTKLLTKEDPAVELYDSIGLPRIHEIFQSDSKTPPKPLDSYPSEIHSILVKYFLNPIHGMRYVLDEITESSAHETKIEKTLRLFYTISLVSTITYSGYFYYLFYYWLVPWILVESKLDVLVDDISDHYGLPIKENNKKHIIMNNTRNREGWFVGVHNSNYHVVHHMYPKVPFWNLKKAHDLCMKNDVEYQKLPIFVGWGQIWGSICAMDLSKISKMQ